jgi:hypothetical protein
MNYFVIYLLENNINKQKFDDESNDGILRKYMSIFEFSTRWNLLHVCKIYQDLFSEKTQCAIHWNKSRKHEKSLYD